MKKYLKAKPVVAVHEPKVCLTIPEFMKLNNLSLYFHVVYTFESSWSQKTEQKQQQRRRRSSLTLRVNSHRRMGVSKRSKPRRVKSTQPRRSDLVYLEPSPNYCDYDEKKGTFGTRGRRCIRSTPHGGNVTLTEYSCEILCCGRGYNTHQMWRRWKCHCKFRWCCEVECQNCQERVEIYTCN